MEVDANDDFPRSDASAAFFIEDVLSYAFRECRIASEPPKTDVFTERPSTLSYNFTPEMGQALMVALVMMRDDIHAEREEHLKPLESSSINERRWKMFSTVFYNSELDDDPFLISRIKWGNWFYRFLVKAVDLIIHLHKRQEMELMRDVIVAAESNLDLLMSRGFDLPISYINEFSRQLLIGTTPFDPPEL